MEAAGHIQPALVNAEGLYQVGVFVVQGVDPVGVLPVEGVMRGQQHQTGTLLPGLPDGLRRLDAAAFGRLVLGQNDAVPGGGITAYRRGDVPQLRVAEQLHRGIEAVEVTVQNDAVHDAASFLRKWIHLV